MVSGTHLGVLVRGGDGAVCSVGCACLLGFPVNLSMVLCCFLCSSGTCHVPGYYSTWYVPILCTSPDPTGLRLPCTRALALRHRVHKPAGNVRFVGTLSVWRSAVDARCRRRRSCRSRRRHCSGYARWGGCRPCGLGRHGPSPRGGQSPPPHAVVSIRPSAVPPRTVFVPPRSRTTETNLLRVDTAWGS